ncbi:GNAT family N-acetyltransferase [Adhaeribacter arboris]|uniref:GNAT family N-acetyltransferase n=1 Tax=Adhaeribacter arboris TaxID=2072846 RepID=A0A2T2YHQ9_9BACT|nr:N-acetyltransferase [Adhaeribacter arboris]PSR55045.1 GNAT family N-acetyltransferase [Adhaeribacter arboris]
MNTIRPATLADKEMIQALYKKVAAVMGGIARVESEITEEYVTHFISKSEQRGIEYVIENPENKEELVAEIHCYQPEPSVFAHVLSDLTIVVHPEFQGKGLGKILFMQLLQEIRNNRPDIYRVELIVRESNQKAIAFYQSLGFVIEGRMANRIDSRNGELEADIPMAWFNQNFKKKSFI